MADIRVRRRVFRHRVPRIIQDRENPLEVFTGGEVRRRFRFSPETIIEIVALLANDIANPTDKAGSIPPLLMVLCTLRFLATGAFQLAIGDTMGVSQAAVSNILSKVCKALASKADRYIRIPQGRDAAIVRAKLHEIAGFPGCIGIIDGTLIRIVAPIVREAAYVCRKGYHAINCQVVCDHKNRITNVVALWPGSVHDSRIFRQSMLCRNLENGLYRGHLIGDSGYSLRHFLLTPYLSPATVAQQRYNTSLTKTRVLVEQSIGILKRRFACLHGELRLSPEKSALVFVACVVLNNIAIEHREQLPGDDVDFPVEEIDNIPLMPANAAAVRSRDIFAVNFFG